MSTTGKEERAILEAIRQGTAPPVIKRQASRGTIPVAAEELLEILVLLTNDPDPTCSEEAKRTLAAWPTDKCAALLAGPETSSQTLAYFASADEVPETIVTAIVAHPHADDGALQPLAGRLSLERVQEVVSNAPRLESLPAFVAALLERTDLPADLRSRLESLPREEAPSAEEVAVALAREEEAETQAKPEERRQRLTLTQRIARMSVSERVRLALKGNKDERMILIRDPSRAVYRAVLESPKLLDIEVEFFASMKNIAEDAFRIIAASRKFMKNYIVVRNLASNPRTPIDISLALLNRLNSQDLKFLSMNRNISETVRSIAFKLHKKRADARRAGR